MAVVEGTVSDFYNPDLAAGPMGHITISSVAYEIWTGRVKVKFDSGTYDQTDEASFDPREVINDNHQKIDLPVIVAAKCDAEGVEGETLEAGTKIVFGRTDVAGGANVTGPLLLEDFSTERAATAMETTWKRPITMGITYLVKAD
jgi:hypothetical protein